MFSTAANRTNTWQAYRFKAHILKAALGACYSASKCLAYAWSCRGTGCKLRRAHTLQKGRPQQGQRERERVKVQHSAPPAFAEGGDMSNVKQSRVGLTLNTYPKLCPAPAPT